MKKLINFIIVTMKFITSILIVVTLLFHLAYLFIIKKLKERKMSNENLNIEDQSKILTNIDGRIDFTKSQILTFAKFNYTKENINNLIEKI